MKIWMDTEFNGWNGDLISMALLPENGLAFYEVLDCHSPSDWVKQNVIPNLRRDPISKGKFQYLLGEFINQFDEIHLVASWPSDFVHFMNLLIISDGMKMKHPKIIMEMPIPTKEGAIIMQKNTTHNALDDAVALKIAHP